MVVIEVLFELVEVVVTMVVSCDWCASGIKTGTVGGDGCFSGSGIVIGVQVAVELVVVMVVVGKW